MTSRDADQTAAPAGFNPASTVDRLSFLDQHLCQRLQEIEAAEARLSKKFEQITAAEQRLINLQNAMSHSTTAAGATIAELAEFREKAQGTTAGILRAAQADFAKLVEVGQK